jgi:glycine hydroxymethyltransferase
MKSFIESQEAEVYSALQKENERQESSLELIASENFVSRAIMEAYHSTLTNKRFRL